MKAILASIVLVLGGLAFAAPASSAGQEKSDVCHVADDQQVLLITIADPAIDSHIAHGDSQPGDELPASDEYPYGAVFGGDCVPVPNEPPIDSWADVCDSIPGATGHVAETVYDPELRKSIVLGRCLFGNPVTVAQGQEIDAYASPLCQDVTGYLAYRGTQSTLTTCVWLFGQGGIDGVFSG